MALILCIESSNTICSVALAENGLCIDHLSRTEKNSHSAFLTLLVEELLQKNNARLDAIALSLGPGSYTGLRIGTSAAKGLAFALDIPVLGMTSTSIIANAYFQQTPNYNGLVCPMIDARRMEVYSAVYNSKLELVQDLAAEILDENSYNDLLQNEQVLFLGDGAFKFEHILSHNKAIFDHKQFLLAKEMATAAELMYTAGDVLDTAYFEPTYIKEFMALTSKKKFF
jgi:tRNA threonylcarbamoyladenosine biosynthesis protein TsaB